MRQVAESTDTSPEPLTETVFFLLSSLAKEPLHGYALMKDIEIMSSGRVRLSTCTLYGALRRLLEWGWIERFQTDDTSRDKQAYRLTGLGRRQLQSEVDRLNQLARVGSARLRTKEAR